jgi:hypothetical protein
MPTRNLTRSSQDLEEFYLDELIDRASVACQHVSEPPCLRCLVGELGFEQFEAVKQQRPRRDDGMQRLLRDVLG